MPERVDHGLTVIGADRRLGDIGKRVIVRVGQRCHVGGVLDKLDAAVDLAHRALDLGVTGVTDHQHGASFGAHAGNLAMHLGDKRTGGVENAEAPALRLFRHRPRHAVGREDDRRTLGHLGKIVDEDRAALTQTVDDRAVVHDLVPDIDGRAVDGKRTLNDRDGARDARAETARLGKENLHDCHFLVTDFACRRPQTLPDGAHMPAAVPPKRSQARVRTKNFPLSLKFFGKIRTRIKKNG